jgi:predicted RNase H-like nuclease (RuvC/YqgF family)
MDEKIWNFALKVGGTGGFLIVCALLAWKVGLFSWLGAWVNRNKSGEDTLKLMNEASAEIHNRQKEEIKALREEIKALKEDHNKELKEKKEAFASLEAQYDLLASQYREARRNIGYDEARLLAENRQQRERIIELESELAKAQAEIAALKKILNSDNDYTPISSE